MARSYENLTASLEHCIDVSLPFGEQTKRLNALLQSYFGSDTTGLWSYLEDYRPLKNTSFDLGIGFETSDNVSNWLRAHPYCWQATLALLTNPVQTWSRDKRFAPKVLTELLLEKKPQDADEKLALQQVMFSLLETPIWRPKSIRAVGNLCVPVPLCFWILPNLFKFDFVKYKSSPLVVMLRSNLSYGSDLHVSDQILSALHDQWPHIYSTDLPTSVKYIYLSEILSWTDDNWLSVTGTVRSQEVTWSLIEKWNVPKIMAWKDLLDGDLQPHLSLSVFLKNSLKHVSSTTDFADFDDIVNNLEFTLDTSSF